MADGEPLPPTSSTPATPSEHRSNWTAGRVIGLVVAGLTGLVGLALIVGGVAVLAVYGFARDDDGFFATDRVNVRSATYAITTQEIDLGDDDVDWAPDAVLGDVRIRVYAGRQPVFVGIAPDADVERYLAGVAHAELTDVRDDTVVLRAQPGGEPPAPPGAQRFWEARSAGPGEQTLTWDAEFGRWSVVIMNADAARGIDVQADAGVKLDWGVWVGVGLLVAGLLLALVAAAVVAILARSAGSAPVSPPPPAPPA